MSRGKSLKVKDFEYHTPLYKDLLETVVPLRTTFRREKDLSARKEMASEEYGAWSSYQEKRKEEVANLEQVKVVTEENLDRFEEHHQAGLHYNH